MQEFLFNLVNSIVLAALGLISSARLEKRKKEILRDRLLRDGWKWRRMKSLRNAIQEDEPTTRRLLFEIGARASTTGDDLWTLEQN